MELFLHKKTIFAQPKLEYQCLDQDSAVKAIKYDASVFFVFNGHADYKPTMKYTIGLGLTTLKNVPMGHPIAILNKGLEKK